MARLENTQEVRDGEAAEHQAHGQQGGVGVRPLDLQLVNGDVAIGVELHVLRDDRDEGVVHGVVQVVVVQDQRVGLEDLRAKARRREGESRNTTGRERMEMMRRNEETLTSLLKVS